jgi:hypothetical protein
MEQSQRSLDEASSMALARILQVLEGSLLADELDADLGARLIKAVARTGLLPENATLGELTTKIRELDRHLRYATGLSDEMPQTQYSTTYILTFETHEAAKGCERELAAAENLIAVSLIMDDRTQKWSALATFPTLPPSPDHHHVTELLERLALRHGGQLSGFQG